MNNVFFWSVIGAGVLLSALLLRFCLKTWKKIQAIEADNKHRQAADQARRENALTSIKVIAQCLLDEQVELSEGSIRIKVLLDHLAPELHEIESFSVFSKMYNAMAHMPTHEARKKADKRLIHTLDQERFKLEEDNKQAIHDAAKAILAYKF